MGVAERFHDEIEIMCFTLKGDRNFGARASPAAQDVLLDGCQASAFFTADDFGVGASHPVVFGPGQNGGIDPGVTQFRS